MRAQSLAGCSFRDDDVSVIPAFLSWALLLSSLGDLTEAQATSRPQAAARKGHQPLVLMKVHKTDKFPCPSALQFFSRKRNAAPGL